jgi:hypothetical protein
MLNNIKIYYDVLEVDSSNIPVVAYTLQNMLCTKQN